MSEKLFLEDNFKRGEFHHSLSGGLLNKPLVNMWNSCVLKIRLAVSEANMPPACDRWSASPILTSARIGYNSKIAITIHYEVTIS